jgi:hypothetical protein
MIDSARNKATVTLHIMHTPLSSLFVLKNDAKIKQTEWKLEQSVHDPSRQAKRPCFVVEGPSEENGKLSPYVLILYVRNDLFLILLIHINGIRIGKVYLYKPCSSADVVQYPYALTL